MDYESGKAIPNNQVMGKIERALGECFIFNLHECTLLKKIVTVPFKHYHHKLKINGKVMKGIIQQKFFCFNLI